MSLQFLLITPEFPPGGGGIGTHAFQISKGLNELGLSGAVITGYDYVSAKEAQLFDQKQFFRIIRIPSSRLRLLNPLIKLGVVTYYQFHLKPKVILCSSWRSNLFGLIGQKIRKVPRIGIGHGSEFLLKNPIYRFLSQKLFQSCDYVISVSEFTKSLMMSQGICESKITVILNGADTSRFFPREKNKDLIQEHQLKGKIVLLTVGRICERKGQDLVLKAMSTLKHKYPHLHYIMVGQPQEKLKIEQLAKDLGLTHNISLLGLVEYDLLPEIYALADIYILNSRIAKDGDNEGFGISIIEAALCKVPSIGTKGCGIEEAIEDGKTGILIESDQVPQTTAALEKLLSDPELRKKWGEFSRTRALEGFAWSYISKQYLAIIKKYT